MARKNDVNLPRGQKRILEAEEKALENSQEAEMDALEDAAFAEASGETPADAPSVPVEEEPAADTSSGFDWGSFFTKAVAAVTAYVEEYIEAQAAKAAEVEATEIAVEAPAEDAAPAAAPAEPVVEAAPAEETPVETAPAPVDPAPEADEFEFRATGGDDPMADAAVDDPVFVEEDPATDFDRIEPQPEPEADYGAINVDEADNTYTEDNVYYIT